MKESPFLKGVLATRDRHHDGPLHYFSLAPEREKLLRQLGPAEFERRCEVERNRVSVLWLDGFIQFNPLGQENLHRQCSERGTMIVVNPSSTTRSFKASMVMRSSTTSAGQLIIEGGELWSEKMSLTNSSPLIERPMIVPPGRHTIRFCYAPSRDHVPGDSRNLMFFIAMFTLNEVEVSR